MTDLTLRQRERTSQIHDDPASQADLLVAQIRAGEIPPALVSLHAELGDEIAGLVVTPSWAKSGGADKPDESLIRSWCSEPEHGLAYDDPRWGRMCYVPAGVSVVGSKDDDQQAHADEKPQHLVYVPEFWMQQHPATPEQAGIGEKVSGGAAAVNISWNDCHEMLTKDESPVEELRALRGGSWYFGSTFCRASFRRWITPDYRNNNLGFRVVLLSPQDQDPESLRAFRGGSWLNASSYCRASFRNWYTPGSRSFNLGFRVVLSPPQDGGSWLNASANCRASRRHWVTPDTRSFSLGFRVVLSPPQDSSLPSAVLPSYRLPLEDEFERAARGWDGRIYPWGNEWIEDRAERLSKPSSWGIYGLCGEVWGWCQNAYVADRRPLIQQPEEKK